MPGEDTGHTITLNGNSLAVHLDPHDHKDGYKIVFIDVKKLDKAFAETDNYVGPGGEGQIRTRYHDIGKWLEDAEFITASNLFINKNGVPIFGNGRHRYAWLRDAGFNKIPVAMDAEGIENAKQFGYI